MSTLAVCEPGQPVTPRAPYEAPREFFGNRFVYAVISPRARGLSIGVNMAPDGKCAFDCVYCEVNRLNLHSRGALDLDVMSEELEKTLNWVRSGQIHQHPFFGGVSEPLLMLRHVTLSGDGEPTMCPQFSAAVESVVHVRAKSQKFFKIVLVTNAAALDRDDVIRGLRYFTREDEIWAKLDAGTQGYAEKVNHPTIELDRIQANILRTALKRPVIIQSLFPAINGIGPTSEEIDAYVNRLKALKAGGAQISFVQIYSATRPTEHSECGHLPLRTLMNIARKVREGAGLHAEVF